MTKERVVLAYSGGLDTSVAVKWLQEECGLDVVAVAVDVGQTKGLNESREKALSLGAVESIVVEAKEEFAAGFILPALKANALYENKYPLISALSRPLISKHLVRVAEETGATAVAHGCTGKGNDQVRFEASIAALNPELRVIAPVREHKMTRQEAMEYAETHHIPVPTSQASPYSIDSNMWGRAIECGDLEDPSREPPSEVYELTSSVEEAPAQPSYIEVFFTQGRPTALNGKELDLVDLINQIGQVAGRHGCGRIDMIENRLIGIKSREIYEAPAAIALLTAHGDLENLTLDRETLHYKSLVEQKYAELVYYGLWYSPLKEALDAFIEKTQQSVTGAVRLKLHRGSCVPVGRWSDETLYDYGLATYEGADKFSHQSAQGFIELWSLPLKVWASKKKRKKGK